MTGGERGGANRHRLAMIGSRGMPADLPKAGGGERETEAKATRLASRGHSVTVYCRWYYNRHPQSPYNGVNLISLPCIATKSLETISHTFLATMHAILFNTADIVNYHGMGNSLFLPLLKLGRKRSVVYMDGVDWDRPKWGVLARAVLKIAAKVTFQMADAIYVDNRASQRVFMQLFGREPVVITLAADLWDPPGSDILQKYNLEPQKYVLFVGVLQPDKGVDLLIEAYKGIDTTVPLVLVGDNYLTPEYVTQLKTMADARVRFLGFVYGKEARQLFANCLVYVQPSRMEGNSPALMSAMACGRCVIVNGIEQNLETIGEAGIAFRPNDAESLRANLDAVIKNPDWASELGRKARQRIEDCYTWDKVVDQLEQLYGTFSSSHKE